MSKQFLAVIAIIILVFVGIFAFNNHGSDNSNSKGAAGTPTQHIEGQGKSGVTLVEYGDYQCPYCGQYYPIVKQVQKEFNDQIYFQFRNFPLTNVHQNAFAGARAAEAAAEQGKFWEMHDLLYDNQAQWSESGDPVPFFKQYAKQLGLNADKFNKDYASSKVNDAINADMAAGNKLKVKGTPAFFLDGKEIQVTASPASFEKQIKEAITQKTASQNQ